MRVALLSRGDLDSARDVLGAACIHDRAAEVAEEKLFAPGPDAEVEAWGAFVDDALVGVAATSASWIRVLAVAPGARGRGTGGALLAHCESVLRAAGVTRARAVSQPGNFLAPGIDDRNAETIAWLERRGWTASTHRNLNLRVDVRTNPQVTTAARDAAVARATAAGYVVRRARPDELAALAAAAAAEFGGSWPFEIARAVADDLHVAARDGAIAGFALHDGNNRGLGWFGPAGTWPAHRGQGLGEALLLACLLDVAVHQPVCEVAWIGPRGFYERVVGVAGERRFVPMSKEL